MKLLMTLGILVLTGLAHASPSSDPIWGKSYYRHFPHSVMAKARDLHKSCKSYRIPSLVKSCLRTEIKNVRLDQVSAHDRISVRSPCMNGEKRRILTNMNMFYLSSIPFMDLSNGDEAQLVEQLLNDLNYLDGIEASIASGQPLLCG